MSWHLLHVDSCGNIQATHIETRDVLSELLSADLAVLVHIHFGEYGIKVSRGDLRHKKKKREKKVRMISFRLRFDSKES